MLEAAREGGIAVVPLAADEGGVARLAEGFRPRRVAHQLLINVEEVAPGEEHGARGHAGRAVQAALHIGAVEGHTAAHEAVEVRCLDGRVAQRGDGVRALVVGEDEEDIGPGGSSIGGWECAQRCEQQGGEEGQGGVHREGVGLGLSFSCSNDLRIASLKFF